MSQYPTMVSTTAFLTQPQPALFFPRAKRFVGLTRIPFQESHFGETPFWFYALGVSNAHLELLAEPDYLPEVDGRIPPEKLFVWASGVYQGIQLVFMFERRSKLASQPNPRLANV